MSLCVQNEVQMKSRCYMYGIDTYDPFYMYELLDPYS